MEFDDAIDIAYGCRDYGGGHRGEMYEAFQHGIQTVVNCLEAAKKAEESGANDTQINVVRRIGKNVRTD